MTRENYRRYILVGCWEFSDLEQAQEKVKKLESYSSEKKESRDREKQPYLYGIENW